MFNIWLGLYIIFAIVAGIGGIMYFMKSSKNISAGIYFLGSLAIFIVFGLKWFSGSSPLFGTPSPVQWPPNINTCPDFLTYYPLNNNGTIVNTCIDRIGVSRNGNLKKFPTDKAPDPKESSYYLTLPSTNVNDPTIRSQLCALASQFGLTWEGITDGESCIAVPASASGASTTLPPPTQCPSSS